MRFLIAILTAICILSAQPMASAQEVKGGPDALIGKFGATRQQCQSYHRKSDNMESFSKKTWSSCAGSGCEAQIVSHRKTTDGFRLRLVSRGTPKGWEKNIRQIDPDIFELIGSGMNGANEIIVRCNMRDAIAGIGRETNECTVQKASCLLHSIFYAESVTSRCEHLSIDRKIFSSLLEVGSKEWMEFRRSRIAISSLPRDLADTIDYSKREAETNARQDADHIPDFCTEVMGAFGPGGKIVPDLLTDKRQKT